ncbi:hypothetical protein JOB18_044931 [Solea senegalensis]|uniref:Uncharacterized protein n=1 Tax=Solea senegalensis TaxID=28829 RepID=A0AAV6RSC6_SOLSE|nr:hypothetical protein JOB18_044931 [Solea senegalensis]
MVAASLSLFSRNKLKRVVVCVHHHLLYFRLLLRLPRTPKPPPQPQPLLRRFPTGKGINSGDFQRESLSCAIRTREPADRRDEGLEDNPGWFHGANRTTICSWTYF